MKNRLMSIAPRALLGGSLILLATLPAVRAVDVVFKNVPGTTSLTNTTNWDGEALPGVGDMATWGAAVGGNSQGGALSWASGTGPSYQGIKVVDASANIAITSAGGATTLTLGSGGIDMSGALKDLSIHDSATAGTTLGIVIGANQSWNVGSGRLLAVGNSDTTLTLSNKLIKTGAGTFTLGGTGATTLSGAGELEINGGIFNNNMQTGSSSSARSGATTLTSGTLSIATSISMFGTGAINLNGGAIGSFSATGRDFGTGNALNIGGNVQIGGSGGGLGNGYVRFGGPADLGGGVRTITSIASGVLAGNGAGAILNGIVSNGGITKEGAGYITLGNNGNTFSGATTINAGSLAFSQKALAASSSVTLANSGVNLVIGENGAGSHDINNLSGVSGSVIRSDFSLSGTNTARTLKITQTANGAYAGSFIEGGGRAISLVKSGSATLTLSGTAAYTGATTVEAGTLLVNGAYTGGGLITVSSGATLGGSGSVSQANIAAGGTLAPGASAGSFTTTGALTFDPAAILSLELGAPSLVQNPGSDFVTVGGALTLGGTINISAITGFGTPVYGDKWLVMTSVGLISDNGVTIGSTPALGGGLSFTIDASDGAKVFLSMVPEAGTGALFTLALVLFLLRRARRG